MDKLQKPDRGPADTLRSFPFRSALNMEEYAPTDGFFGDPSICSMELGETITEHTSTVIAEEVRRYLKAFPKRWRKES